MRKLVLGEFASTAFTWAVSLACFSVLNVWSNSREARTAALFLVVFAVYFAVLVFRFLVRDRSWDLPANVAVFGTVGAALASMGGVVGVLVVLLPFLAFPIFVGLRPILHPGRPNPDIFQRELAFISLWVQYFVIMYSLLGLSMRGLPL